MSKFFFIILLTSLCNVSLAASDLKNSTKTALERIEKEKDICFKKAKFSAEASGCLESAVKRIEVILDIYTDLKADRSQGDAQEILNIYKDQQLFKDSINNCEVFLKLSRPSNSFYSVYQCQLNIQELYFNYL